MRLGVIFPQTEIGTHPDDVRRFVKAVESLGYNHLAIYDHVLGAQTADRTNWPGPYTEHHQFHEVMVLFGYFAGLTERIELVTSVLILPQRQTALVAKQAAEIDVLSGGRLRLGVGIGWNWVEYEALNENFRNRGRREEEQITVLRALWTEPVVTFDGRWHHIDAAGLNPLPAQRPIPIWMGGSADVAMRRAARIADGWFPQVRADAQGAAAISRFLEYVRDAGRDISQVGIEARISYGDGDAERWRREVDVWTERGASHLSLVTMNSGLDSPDEHIAAIERFMRVVSA